MSAKKKRVLVVEDNDALRMVTSRNLQKAGLEVLEAANGEAGLKMLAMFDDIGVIFLDIMMPKMNGMEFLEKVKGIKSEQHFKICMLTAKGQSDDVKKCLSLGADDYLIKPIDVDQLLEKVKVLQNGIGSSQFAKIKCNLKGSILRVNSQIDIQFTFLSEMEMGFSSPIELPLNAKVQLECKKLGQILGSSQPLYVRIFRVERGSGGFDCLASFIGLKDEQFKQIRSITTKGEELSE